MTAAALLTIREPGWLTTVQDLGRWGWQHLGVPVAGPMDMVAFRRANRLVGNEANAATLEVTLNGPTLEIAGDVTLAIAGASFNVRLDGRPLPHESAVRVAGGGRLEVGERRIGARAYLAVTGGFEWSAVLGSRATSLDVLGGRALRRGDVLMVGQSQTEPVTSTTVGDERRVSPVAIPTSWDGVCLRVLPCSWDQGGAADAYATLCAGIYEVAPQSNRMGYRLLGPRVDVRGAGGYSSGTVMGLLQVPPDGQPILLMADRQTTGGYPVVGAVISADLSRAGQLAPGDHCCFAACTRQNAMAALIAQEQGAADA